MSTKLVTSVVVAVLLGLGAGYYLGQSAHTEVSVAAAVAATRQDTTTSAALSESNHALQRENARLDAELARVTAEREQLLARAQRAEPASAAPTKAGPILGWMPRYEQQRIVMGYLRQVAAVRDQYVLEHGHPPKSIHEVVGINGYIKTIRPVAGENYSELPMDPSQPLSVTTADGMTVTLDPTGKTTTPIDLPPELAEAEKLQTQARQLAQKGNAARQKALEAYRVVNAGKDPARPDALVPFFPTPQEGADYVEFLEVQKAAAAAAKASTQAQRAAGGNGR